MKMNVMKKLRGQSFRRNPVAALVLLTLASQFGADLAQANGAFGSNTDVAGTVLNVPTYFANSPQGIQPAFDPATHAYSVKGVTVDTGTPLRKFVDPLAGAYNGLGGAGIPLAISEKWVNLSGVKTGDDYYEIGIVEYTEQMHSDLPKQTRLRGYVQIETPAIAAGLKDVTGVLGSEHIKAMYPDGKTPILDKNGAQVYFVHQPHYLGPVIIANRGVAVRLKATNYLPYTDASGKSVGSWNGQGGELPIPVDESIPGGGPVLDALGNQVFAKDVNGNPVLDNKGNPLPIKMSENRAGIHWHGGDTPWISDGTPHQWFAPAGDISNTINDADHPKGLGRGDSAQNVPDMADPGAGSSTLYFPNNLSGRLMFYHDHTSGLTRLNVYAGMAAGYVVVDDVELNLVANAIGTTLDKTANGLPTGLLDSVGIPLVIQDKTFVPKNIGPNAVASDGFTPQSQDAKWDLNHWGQPGDLFFPHVYETNQDPNSADGTNPVGRWDWGPWFWPVFPAQLSLPTGDYGSVTTTPEAFMDTAVVNGVAYPTLTVDPKTYRFRILGVANDRTQNLGLYQAVDAAGNVCDGNSIPVANVKANGGTAVPASCTEIKMVPALPTPGFPLSWPVDGRVGGVPDPATAGPDIVQIGNEAGLLPAPAIWKSQPVTYETNVRSITVFNIMNHDLLLGGAERADVLIDFSQYAGQTLIVYNDAPAPMPGFDPRIDYYTGVGDQTAAGGAYNTPPGYGPNTRTVMQIKVNAVNASGTGGPLDTAALAAAMPKAYALTQPAPIIPAVAYNAPFGTHDGNNYATIGTGSSSVAAPGSPKNSPNAVAGYYTYTDSSGVVQKWPVINKAIQELFDPVYGRMNATLAVELPYSSATVATTIPLSYIDTPVEKLDAIKDGETQIWKITHNGVDGHPVHFHLVNVQVINRVGWDGTIKPPEANELGWKETLRMNPLEDVYVAVKASRPVVPFGVPKSARLLDPSQLSKSTMGFTQIDPTNGRAPTTQTQIVGGVSKAVGTTMYANVLTDFDNEYVWHCHILGHEEFDFMRPFVFHPTVIVPDAPAHLTQAGKTLSWIDTTPVGGQDAQGIPTAGTNAVYTTPISSPKNEIGFTVCKAGSGPFCVGANLLATLPANTTSWTDVATHALNYYSVYAYNAAGGSKAGSSITTTTAGALVGKAAALVTNSTAAPVLSAAAGPTGLTQTLNADGTVSLAWVAVPGATGYVVSINGVAQAPVVGTSYIATVAGVLSNAFTVTALTRTGATAGVAAKMYAGAALAPTIFNAISVPGAVTLNWANSATNVNNVTGYDLSWTLCDASGVALAPTVTRTLASGVNGATVVSLPAGGFYKFQLVANSKLGNSSVVATPVAITQAL